MQSEKITDYLIDWLKDYLIKSHQKGFVIGISGGVDSAVVSTLCAMTGFPVLCLELPIYQKNNEISRAKNHIKWLKSKFSNVSQAEIDLTPTFSRFEKSVSLHPDKAKTDLALANSRSRLRMMTLYYYAGINNFIVAGTGNKIEDFGVGFFTKYGDGGVDISPIGDLNKTQVYHLARHLNIISEIQSAIPTDGLFDDSKSDEEQLGATYPELEWAMEKYEANANPNDFTERQKAVYEIFVKRHTNNLHKIEPIPIYIIPEEWKSPNSFK